MSPVLWYISGSFKKAQSELTHVSFPRAHRQLIKDFGLLKTGIITEASSHEIEACVPVFLTGRAALQAVSTTENYSYHDPPHMFFF